jgi:hypothetical protein
MSSFFRSANDITDTSPEYTGAAAEHDEDSELSNSQIISKTSTHDSTLSIGEDNHPATVALNNDPSRHSQYLIHTLLEEKCLNDAMALCQESNGGNEVFTKDHPEVKRLAELRYKHMSKPRLFPVCYETCHPGHVQESC